MSDKSTLQQPRVWLLLGQKAGDNNQILALAEQLGWPWQEKNIVSRPTELLTNLALKVTLAGIDRKRSSNLKAPWPDLVISAGRRNEPVARWIKQQSGGTSKLVHIGRPWAPLSVWDLVVTTPQYFLPEADNILHNRLPLHRIGSRQLDAARSASLPWQDLPPPYITVLLGGDSGPFVFTAEKARRLAEQVNAIAESMGGSVLATDSRRTPQAALTAFKTELKIPSYCHSWRDRNNENPYLAMLASADILVVTGESMSMLAEAEGTGKPLFIFNMSDSADRWWSRRHNFRYKPLSHRVAMAIGPKRMLRDISRIQDNLVAQGKACWLENWKENDFRAANAAEEDCAEARVAAERVRALFAHP